MKKLMILVLLAVFAAGCTATNIEEDYETQAIEHEEVGEEDHPEELMEGDPDRS